MASVCEDDMTIDMVDEHYRCLDMDIPDCQRAKDEIIQDLVMRQVKDMKARSNWWTRFLKGIPIVSRMIQ